MAYTEHGHQIPGTEVTGTPPAQRARCGGPGLCPRCSQQAMLKRGEIWKIVHLIESQENRVTVCTGEPYPGAGEIPPGRTVSLCTVCYQTAMSRGVDPEELKVPSHG